MGARYASVTAGFAAFFTVFFAPALFGGNYMTVAGDGSNIALPAYLVPHGLWEPDIMLGYPWASNFNGYWDPLFLLHFIPNSFNVYMLSAYVIAAVCAFGCVDVLTGSLAGGIVSGLSYAVGGFMIGHFGHYDIVHAAAWTPAVFWAFFVLRKSSNAAPVVLGSIAIALCALGGQPQVLTYTLVFAVAYCAFVLLSENDERLLRLRRFCITLVLGLGLASIALVPGLFLALASFRAHASLDYFLAYSIPVWQIPLRLLFPYLIGHSNLLLYPYSQSMSEVGPDAEYSGYIGILALLFATNAVLAKWRDGNVRFLAIAACAGLVLSAGDGFHIAALTFRIPLLNLFRAQGRNMLEFTLFASILAGIGVSTVQQSGVVRRKLVITIAAGAIALATVVAIASASGMMQPGAIGNPALLIPIVLFVAAAVLLTRFAHNPSSRLLAMFVIVLTAIDISSFGWFEYWREPVNASMLQPPPIVARLKADLDRTHQRVFSVAGAEAGSGIPPNLSLVWGIPSAGGYVQLLLTSPGILLQLFPQGTIAPDVLLNGTDRSFDLAAIKYIVMPPAQVAAFQAIRPGWRPFDQSPAGVVLKNPSAAPRVHIFHHVVALSIDDTLRAIRTGSVDTATVAMIQGGPTLQSAPSGSDNAAITALGSDFMKVAVACASDCFLQTSDNYSGMWKVTIDGAPAPLRLADYTFRGVFVPAGTHEVAFTYRPWTIYLGALLTGLSALVLAGIAVRSRLSGFIVRKGARSGEYA